MTPIHVPLQSRRQQRVAPLQKLNHVIPAFGLLFGGLEMLGEGVQGFVFALAVFEIAASAALIVAFARSLRAVTHLPEHAHHGTDWVDVFAAGVLFAEAGEQWHLKHHIARPVLLTALIVLLMGVFHGRFMGMASRRRGLRIDDSGIRISGRPFRAFRATWGEIASIEIGEATAAVCTDAGRTRRLDLNDLLNAGEVRRVLADARSRLAAGEA